MLLKTKDLINILNKMPFKKHFYCYKLSNENEILDFRALSIDALINKDGLSNNKTLDKKEELKIMSMISYARDSKEDYYFCIIQETLYNIETKKKYQTYMFKVDTNTRKIIEYKKDVKREKIPPLLSEINSNFIEDFSIKTAIF